MLEKRYTEEELIDPALYAIDKHEGKLTTGQLIKVLIDILNPIGEDAEILFGRKDTRFSQKVRNLISHKSLYPKYVDYEPNSSLLTINENGRDRLFSSVYYKEKRDAENADDIFEFDGEEDLEQTENFDYINKKYVDCEPLNYSVFELKRRFDRAKDSGAKGVLILDDSFQRKNVWTRKQKSQLIESIILGIPIPYLYLYEGKYGNLIVIDGRQRLSALFDFLDDQYALSNLEFITQLNGKRAKDLVDNLTDNFENYKAKVEDAHLHVIKVGYETAEIFKLKLFERVNQNGTKLNNQELRHALHQGLITKLLEELSEANNILQENAKSRMKDRYLVLRYISMRLFLLKQLKHYYEKGSAKEIEYNEINTFLANAMDAINTFSENQIAEIKTDFQESYKRALNIFGVNVFKLEPQAPINMILFEVTLLFISLSKRLNLPDESIVKMLEDFRNYNKEKVDKNGDTPFFKNIKYHRDSKENFKERVEWIEKIIKEAKG